MTAASSSRCCSTMRSNVRGPRGDVAAGGRRSVGEELLREGVGEHRVHPVDRIGHAHRTRSCRRGSRRAARACGCARGRPRPRWYCTAILSATSTETEPESAKKTCCSGSGVQLHQAAAEVDGRPVGEPAEHHVAHRVGLAAYGVVEPRVPVAVDRAPPRRHRVDQRRAVGQPDPDALGVVDQLHAVGCGHRGVGMPEVLAVEGERSGGVRGSCRGIASRLSPVRAAASDGSAGDEPPPPAATPRARCARPG